LIDNRNDQNVFGKRNRYENNEIQMKIYRDQFQGDRDNSNEFFCNEMNHYSKSEPFIETSCNEYSSLITNDEDKIRF